MPDNTINLQDFNKDREAIESSKKAVFLTKQKIARIADQESSLSRYYREDNQEHVSLKNALETEHQSLDGELITAGNDLHDKEVQFQEKYQELLDQLDPETYMSQLDSKFPVLMMPLRIETRFKKVKNENNIEVDQLWVRVFPDDCMIDTFEEVLSETEIENARTFWADWVIANGKENGQRASWRNLAESHGAGRAQYIINTYGPEGAMEILHDQEPKDEPVYLVINVANGELEAQDREELAEYWEQFWRSNGRAEPVRNVLRRITSVESESRLTDLIKRYIPVNINDDFPDIDRSAAEVEVKFLIFPSQEIDGLEIQQQSWGHAAQVRIMPEKFYVYGLRGGEVRAKVRGNTIPFPLIMGPNPEDEEEDLQPMLDGDLRISPKMKWMVDFDEAVDKGMGFIIDDVIDEDNRVTLGYDRLLVVGVRMTTTRDQGKQLVEELFSHHYNGNSGFCFLPVGTATNNIQGEGSGYTTDEDPDDTFEQMLGKDGDEIPEEVKSWWSVPDRDWFNKLLGLSPGFLQGTINTNGFDQREARAMNIALWPTTWGYFFDTLMRPVLDKHIEDLKWYFNQFVIGRGTLPSIRIDDQPYGILPVTRFQGIRWFDYQFMGIHDSYFLRALSDQKSTYGFFNQLLVIFRLIQPYWQEMAQSVPHTGMEGNAHQSLLKILGHHGGSVEFHSRMAQSANYVWNLILAELQKMGLLKNLSEKQKNDLFEVFKQLFVDKAGLFLLRNLGYKGEDFPEILLKAFTEDTAELVRLVNDQELSEVEGLGEIEETGRNYIGLLIDAAKDSLFKLSRQTLSAEGDGPGIVLFKMLKNALLLGFYTTALKLYKEKNLLNNEVLLEWAHREPDFVNIKDFGVTASQPPAEGDGLGKPAYSGFPSESRYYLLSLKIPEITQDNSLSVGDYIANLVNNETEDDLYVKDQLKALEHLMNIPTARLERLLVEHLDCATYRFDAWKWGLLNYQLLALRNRQVENNEEEGGEAETTDGLYIGAYGWLENIRRDNKILKEAELEELDLPEDFVNPSGKPIMEDSDNFGYIQAPSLNHAVTAAILRNTYLSRASSTDTELFNINLSSDRVRRALAVIEGIQKGQNLAAVLGYQLERYIHDHNKELEMDKYIYALRTQFPLVNSELSEPPEEEDGTVPESEPEESIEAKNVVDGAMLIAFVEEKIEEGKTYFDELNLGTVEEGAEDIIKAAIDLIRDSNDAVADLGMAESIHQVVQGNIERAAGTLEAYSKGNYPQLPDVIQTPRSGVHITHRVGLHIKADASYTGNDSPRAMAEPGINSYLDNILPDLANIVFALAIKLPEAEDETVSDPISIDNLVLQPIDLLYIVNDEMDQGMSLLDDLIICWARNNYRIGGESGEPVPAEAEIRIAYYVRGIAENEVSVFELIPLIKSLRAITLRSRPLKASDISLPNEAYSESDADVLLNVSRIQTILDDYLAPLINSEDADQTDLTKFIANEADDDADEDLLVDSRAREFVEILQKLSLTGLPQTGFGYIYEWQKNQLRNLRAKIQELADGWAKKEENYLEIISGYTEGGDETENLQILMKAERIISTQPTLNPDINTFLSEVENKYNGIFSTKKEVFTNYLEENHTGVGAALKYLEDGHILEYSECYLVETDLSDIRNACKLFLEDLLKKAVLIRDDLEKRLEQINELRSQHDAEGTNPARKVELVQEMGKILLSEDFKMIPSFDMLEEKKDEWENGLANVNNLLAFQRDKKENLLPVDGWIYGLARVREKMGHLEQLMCWSEGFGRNSIEFTPVQLPYREPYCWFALEFGPAEGQDEKDIRKVFTENDHLLYTACYHEAFNRENRQCGLLIDEWTEIVPTEEETAGTAYHYDRPNSEPPQTILFAVSPQFSENWRWEDLVASINETLDEAKLRGVEPDQIDKTDFSAFLPATLAAMADVKVTIASDFSDCYHNYVHAQNMNHER
jgi:hypothetical protein